MTTRLPHLPQQVPIDAYGDGGFRFSGMRRTGSLLCLSSGHYAWRPSSLEDVGVDDLSEIVALEPPPAYILFGVGQDVAPLPAVITDTLAQAGIVPEPMDTGAACRTYNVLLAEGRAVAAALLQVP